MTPEEMQHLTETYGANLLHWPSYYQSAIEKLTPEEQLILNNMLEKSAPLDLMLSSYIVNHPSNKLINTIIESASTEKIKIASEWNWL